MKVVCSSSSRIFFYVQMRLEVVINCFCLADYIIRRGSNSQFFFLLPSYVITFIRLACFGKEGESLSGRLLKLFFSVPNSE